MNAKSNKTAKENSIAKTANKKLFSFYSEIQAVNKLFLNQSLEFEIFLN